MSLLLQGSDLGNQNDPVLEDDVLVDVLDVTLVIPAGMDSPNFIVPFDRQFDV